MSAIDTLRDALFGNPPDPATEPSREGTLAAFTELYNQAIVSAAAAAQGIATVASISARNTFYTDPDNQSKLVYVNNNNGSSTDPANGVYEYVGGSARLAEAFYAGLAIVVQPLVDAASGFADDAEASAVAAAAEVEKMYVQASYGAPAGETLVAGTPYPSANTFRYQIPLQYDWVGGYLDIYNGAAGATTVTVLAFDENGDELATGATYSGKKAIAVPSTGENIGLSMDGFFAPAGAYLGFYAPVTVLHVDTTRKSLMGGFWAKTASGVSTTGVTTLSGFDYIQMVRFRPIEKRFVGSEYANTQRWAQRAERTDYLKELAIVWDGSSFGDTTAGTGGGSHGETPVSYLMADDLGKDRADVISFAVGGDTVGDWLAKLPTVITAIQEQVATGRPVVYVVDLGIVFNSIRVKSLASAGTATADIDAVLTLYYGGLATVKAAAPTCIKVTSDIPKVAETGYWVDAHWDALNARLAATATPGNGVDVLVKISELPEAQNFVGTLYANPNDGVHPMTAFNLLALPVHYAAINEFLWKTFAGMSVARDDIAYLMWKDSGGLKITSFTVSPSQIETGDAQDVTAAWTIAGTITGQTIEGVAVTPSSEREKVFSAVSASNTYDLYVEDTGAPGGTASDTASATVTVLSKWYAGVNNDTSPSDADLLAFGQSGFATAKARTITFDATGGGYPTYAWPAALGALSSVKVGGLAFSDYTVTTRNVVNVHGATVSMRILVFNTLQNGAAIEVQFA